MNVLDTKGVTVCALVFGLALAMTSPATAADVSGRYTCEGDNGYGSKYTGTVTITKKDDTYRVVWKLGDKVTYFGLGIVQSDVLAVSYYDTKLGVIAYKIESDSKLVGKRAMVKGDGTVSTETLTRVEDDSEARKEQPASQ